MSGLTRLHGAGSMRSHHLPLTAAYVVMYAPPGHPAAVKPASRAPLHPAPWTPPLPPPPSLSLPTETKDTPDAPAAAKEQLAKLGPMSRDEKITAAAFAITVGLWIGGAALGVNSVAAATVGLAILLITGEEARRGGGGGGC